MTAYKTANYTRFINKQKQECWGAFVKLGNGRNNLPVPNPGDVVQVTTKAKEVHNRIVNRIIKTYASGVIVALEEDEQVAANANARYQQKVNENCKQVPKRDTFYAHNSRPQLCPRCQTYCEGDCIAN